MYARKWPLSVYLFSLVCAYNFSQIESFFLLSFQNRSCVKSCFLSRRTVGWWVSWPRSCTSTFTNIHPLKKGAFTKALCVLFASSEQGNFILKSANSQAHFATANLQISFSFKKLKKQIHNLQIRKSQKILGPQIANPQSSHLRTVRISK